MPLKKLTIGADLRESIDFHSHIMPLVTSTTPFDEYQNQEWQCHWHDEFEFTVVAQGRLAYQVFENRHRGKTFELNAGDGIFINSGSLHSVQALEPHTVAQDFAFSPSFFEAKVFENFAGHAILPIMETGVSHWLLKNNQQNAPLLSAIAELCNIQRNEIGYELHTIEMVCKVWRLLTVQLQAQLPPPGRNNLQSQRLKKALAYIHAQFGGQISIEDILSHTGISRSECFRIFQSLLDKTPMQYVTEYRLAIAASLLSNTDRTLADISFACGFQTPSYFGKQFRKQYGITPKRYREQSAA